MTEVNKEAKEVKEVKEIESYYEADVLLASDKLVFPTNLKKRSMSVL